MILPCKQKVDANDGKVNGFDSEDRVGLPNSCPLCQLHYGSPQNIPSRPAEEEGGDKQVTKDWGIGDLQRGGGGCGHCSDLTGGREGGREGASEGGREGGREGEGFQLTVIKNMPLTEKETTSGKSSTLQHDTQWLPWVAHVHNGYPGKHMYTMVGYADPCKIKTIGKQLHTQ